MKSRSQESIPGTWSTGQAVDEQRADAQLLEAAGGAAEGVALRRAPVLAVDAADAVPAAAEREPDREPGLEQQLDGLEGLGVADRVSVSSSSEVGRLLLEDPREQLDRLAPARRVDLLRDREGDRALAASRPASSTAWRASRTPSRATSIQCAGRSRRAAAHLELRRGEDRPGVRRDHVAAGGDVRAVHVEHRLRRPVQRPRAPELAASRGLCAPSRCSSVATPPSRMTQRLAASRSSTCR